MLLSVPTARLMLEPYRCCLSLRMNDIKGTKTKYIGNVCLKNDVKMTKTISSTFEVAKGTDTKLKKRRLNELPLLKSIVPKGSDLD